MINARRPSVQACYVLSTGKALPLVSKYSYAFVFSVNQSTQRTIQEQQNCCGNLKSVLNFTFIRRSTWCTRTSSHRLVLKKYWRSMTGEEKWRSWKSRNLMCSGISEYRKSMLLTHRSPWLSTLKALSSRRVICTIRSNMTSASALNFSE